MYHIIMVQMDENNGPDDEACLEEAMMNLSLMTGFEVGKVDEETYNFKVPTTKSTPFLDFVNAVSIYTAQQL